jgi:hypothetical protein
MSRTTSWPARLVLAAAALLYLAIGAKFVTQPESAAARSGLEAVSAVGWTTLRAGLGGFPLGISALLLFCAASPSRTLTGLVTAAGVTGAVLAVRLASAVIDHSMGESIALLAPETVVVVLTSVAALIVRRSAPAI